MSVYLDDDGSVGFGSYLGEPTAATPRRFRVGGGSGPEASLRRRRNAKTGRDGPPLA